LLKEKAAQAAEIITVGEIDHNDVFLTSYAVKGSGIEVTASILGEPVSLALTFRGKHYVLNALVALLLAKKLGLDLQKACAALETFHLLDNRGAVKEIALPQGHVTLIDESYNANPVAVKCAIDRLKDIGEGRRKVLILGEMGELGHEAVAYHEALAPFIKEAAIDRVYVVGGETIKALYDLLPVTMRGAHYVSVHDIPHDFVARLLDQDVLLVKGSLVRQLGLFVKRLEQYAPKEKGHAV